MNKYFVLYSHNKIRKYAEVVIGVGQRSDFSGLFRFIQKYACSILRDRLFGSFKTIRDSPELVLFWNTTVV
jgi:hypothetical protein